jgi:hypothetical protein
MKIGFSLPKGEARSIEEVINDLVETTIRVHVFHHPPAERAAIMSLARTWEPQPWKLETDDDFDFDGSDRLPVRVALTEEFDKVIEAGRLLVVCDEVLP